MQLHFLSFLLDIAAWIFAAIILSKMVLGLKKRSSKDSARLFFTVVMASLIGGFLAELTIGSRGIGISLTNLCVALFASILAIYLAFPKYAILLKMRVMHGTVEGLKTIRVNLQSFRK